MHEVSRSDRAYSVSRRSHLIGIDPFEPEALHLIGLTKPVRGGSHGELQSAPVAQIRERFLSVL